MFFERKVFAFNSLAAAAFFLLSWNTNEIFSTGFQLSFSVVGAILWLADPFFRVLRRWGAPDPFLPRNLLSVPRRFFDLWFGWICRGTSVSLAAWVGSLPLIWWYFYLLTPISLFANLVVVPLAFFVLAIGLLSILSAPFLSALSLVFNNANWFLAKLVLVIVHVFAQLPGGHYYLEHPHRAKDPLAAKITVLDVGTGAAAHLRSDSRDWLLDCGSERDYERLLRAYLHSAGVNRLNGLLLTHGDSLHIGGAARLVDDLPPAILIDNLEADRSVVHRRLRQEFERRRLQSINPGRRESLTLSRNVSVQIFRALTDSPKTRADDQTLVVQVTVAPTTRVLFTSDIGYESEMALVQSGADLRSNILIKGQHHSGESGCDALLDVVQPQLIVATSREFPAHERVSDEWARHVQGRGIKLFRQDDTGAVELRFARDYWEARAYVTGETFRSSNR